jgi:hypothetical protein
MTRRDNVKKGGVRMKIRRPLFYVHTRIQLNLNLQAKKGLGLFISTMANLSLIM